MEINKMYCPVCGKELIRLEPYKNDKYDFWCDNCGIDITIKENNSVNEEPLPFY